MPSRTTKELTLVTDRRASEGAEKQLRQSLRRIAGKPTQIKMSHASGQPVGGAHYLEAENVWFCLEDEENRYWNPGGTGRPTKDAVYNIEIEINPPHSGRNPQIQGAFASMDGAVHLVHRGRVGGRFVGATRNAFWRHAGLSPTTMRDGTAETPVILVCRIDGVGLPASLGRFIRGAASFKSFLRETK